jgi:hypothetical protein
LLSLPPLLLPLGVVILASVYGTPMVFLAMGAHALIASRNRHTLISTPD